MTAYSRGRNSRADIPFKVGHSNDYERKDPRPLSRYTDQPIILVAPTVGYDLPSRDYPKDQYVEVIKKLLTLHKSSLVLLVGTSHTVLLPNIFMSM